MPERKAYDIGEVVGISLGFRTLGGLRDSFSPDVWTKAWEENDKLVRLTFSGSVSMTRAGISSKELGKIGPEVRKAKFYWSRDPDLPYRIWTLIVPEDGSKPIIPKDLEDARSKMFDVVKRLEIPARQIGKGKHTVVGKAKISWGRRSFIEKGKTSSNSKGAAVKIE